MWTSCSARTPWSQKWFGSSARNRRDHWLVLAPTMAAESEPKRLGLIAGGGTLPMLLRKAWEARGGRVFVLAYRDFAEPEAVDGTEHVWLEIAEVEAAIRALHSAGCCSVVLAGAVRRPSWAALGADIRGARLLPKLRRARGDDALLRIVLGELEAEGFRALRADEILAELVAPAGSLGRCAPAEGDWPDIRAAGAAALKIGADDRRAGRRRARWRRRRDRGLRRD